MLAQPQQRGLGARSRAWDTRGPQSSPAALGPEIAPDAILTDEGSSPEERGEWPRFSLRLSSLRDT